MADERDDDVAELRTLFERTRPGDVVWEPPPAGSWDRVAAAIEETPDSPAVAADQQAHVVVPGARRRARWFGLAAAAAAAAVVVAVTVAIVGGGDPSEVVASVELEPLGAGGSGRAELVEREGALRLRVETQDVDATGGYLELWLLDASATRLVSLGPLRSDELYDVPAGVDPAEFSIVDVSVEPVDGDPTHSGQSVLRGELTL